MSLAAGARLGPYEIIAPIGAGGMGEVYEARDTRLDRVVAIKLILAHVAANPEFRERFDREAKAISAIDHPHICTLYDVGHERLRAGSGSDASGDVDFLVMQYLEGETLADRLARASRPTSDPSRPASDNPATVSSVATSSRGPIPLDATLRYAREIASALDAAHRRGIVHRDLKPGNVMLTKSGIKLLDFGLAKLAATPAVAGFGDGATRTSPHGGAQGGPLTGQGALLGTLHYMSPEQLEGREVDARSDVFAFGAVLFEMLARQRAFESQSHAGVIAAIIGADPPPLDEVADVKLRLPLVAHRGLDRLLRKCLAKNPDDRWQSAADLADELKWIDEERLRAAVPTDAPASLPIAPTPVSRPRERRWMAAALVATLGAIGVAVWLYPRPAPPPQSVSFLIDPPNQAAFATGPGLMSVSPDGSRIVFATGEGGGLRLWLRPLGSLEATAIPYTEDGWHPAWSPDGRSIAFTGSGGPARLRRVDLAGGPAVTLAEAALERPAWSSQGVLLHTGDTRARARLYSVPENGGPSTPATELDQSRQETMHAWAAFLPDGRRFIYLAISGDEAKSALYLASLDSPERTHLVDVLSNVDVVPGFLIYQRDGTLMAHPFDEKAGRVTGDATPIVEGIAYNTGNGRGAFAASTAGVLAYRTGSSGRAEGTLTWFDRAGKPGGTVGGSSQYANGQLSPDGRHLAITEVPTTGLNANADIQLFDLDRGVPTRFTTDAGDEADPIWSPDGATIVFRSTRKGPGDLYKKAAGGATAEQVLYESPEEKRPSGFSPDGKLLLFTNVGGYGRSRFDTRIWALPLTGDPKPFRLFPDSSAAEYAAVFSPDGRWIAYVSRADEGPNVYVQPYPPTGSKVRISTTTGSWPQWTQDGKRIVYVTDESQHMAVDVATTGGVLRPGLPQELFTQRQAGFLQGTSRFARMFIADAKGERFLLSVGPQAETVAPLTVVVNWASLLARK